ncbi:MAG: uracil-DNA glycosylase [Pseudomonadota bacterium]
MTQAPHPDIQHMSAAALLDTLQFHFDCGVEECLAEEPVNHFAQTKPAASALPDRLTAERPHLQETPQPQVAISPVVQIAETEAIDAAKTAAGAAGTLDELRAALEAFPHCSLKRTANSTLFAAGSTEAKLAILGDAPGKDDDRTGDLFSGDEGRLLDAMLRAIGLSKDDVYLMSALAWRPPGNRQPTPAELAMCAPFIRRHLELIGHKVLLGLGALPHRMLIPEVGKPKSVMQLRGKWADIVVEGTTLPLLTSLTPRYLLQQPPHKRLAWYDLLELQAKLDDLDG